MAAKYAAPPIDTQELRAYHAYMPSAFPLREHRKHAKLHQTRLAEVAGVDRSVYSRYESGAVVPTVDKALRIAEALDTTVEALFGDGAAAKVEREGGSRYRCPKCGGVTLIIRAGQRRQDWECVACGNKWVTRGGE